MLNIGITIDFSKFKLACKSIPILINLEGNILNPSFKGIPKVAKETEPLSHLLSAFLTSGNLFQSGRIVGVF